MKPTPSSPTHAAPTGPVHAWIGFWFAPAEALGLHAVRIVTGLLLLAWLLPLHGHAAALFGLDGWFDRQAYIELPGLPMSPFKPPAWSVLFFWGNEPSQVMTVFWVSVAVITLFTLGVATRLTGVLSWVAVASFTENPAIDYDADVFLLFFSLYLMLGYLLLDWPGGSLDLGRIVGWHPVWSRASWGSQPSPAANLALRLLQVHFALAVVTSGLHKLQYGDWWNGLAFWYPMHPPFETSFSDLRRSAEAAESHRSLLSLGAYLTLAWQITFPTFAWRRGWWRVVLLIGAAAGWLGAALIFGMPLLGPVLCVGCCSYVTADEWRAILGWFSGAGTPAEHGWSAGQGTTHLVGGGQRR